MCRGVPRGFAWLKFSGSPSRYGQARQITMRARNVIINPSRSFVEKNGWNGILSWSLEVPSGLLDPVWCRKRRCTTTMADRINGNRK
jgi:hypothetical protein